MYSSNYKSQKPGFSDKIKSELKGEEKTGKSYLLLMLIIFLVIAFVFFIIALFGDSSSDVKEVKVEESTANQTESTTEEQATPYSESQGDGEASAEVTPTTDGQTHTVESGDTLAGLGAQYSIDWKKIAEVNNIEAPYSLTVGGKIIIPAAE